MLFLFINAASPSIFAKKTEINEGNSSRAVYCQYQVSDIKGVNTATGQSTFMPRAHVSTNPLLLPVGMVRWDLFNEGPFGYAHYSFLDEFFELPPRIECIAGPTIEKPKTEKQHNLPHMITLTVPQEYAHMFGDVPHISVKENINIAGQRIVIDNLCFGQWGPKKADRSHDKDFMDWRKRVKPAYRKLVAENLRKIPVLEARCVRSEEACDKYKSDLTATDIGYTTAEERSQKLTRDLSRTMDSQEASQKEIHRLQILIRSLKRTHVSLKQEMAALKATLQRFERSDSENKARIQELRHQLAEKERLFGEAEENIGSQAAMPVEPAQPSDHERILEGGEGSPEEGARDESLPECPVSDSPYNSPPKQIAEDEGSEEKGQEQADPSLGDDENAGQGKQTKNHKNRNKRNRKKGGAPGAAALPVVKGDEQNPGHEKVNLEEELQEKFKKELQKNLQKELFVTGSVFSEQGSDSTDMKRRLKKVVKGDEKNPWYARANLEEDLQIRMLTLGSNFSKQSNAHDTVRKLKHLFQKAAIEGDIRSQVEIRELNKNRLWIEVLEKQPYEELYAEFIEKMKPEGRIYFEILFRKMHSDYTKHDFEVYRQCLKPTLAESKYDLYNFYCETDCSSVALGLLEESAKLGYAKAENDFADLFHGEDAQKWLYWIKRAAKRNYPPAVASYNMCLLENVQDEAVRKRAIAALESISDIDTGACYNLGIFYLEGKYGLPKDLGMAKTYLKKSADQGHIKSCQWVGSMCKSEGNIEDAITYFKKVVDCHETGAEDSCADAARDAYESLMELYKMAGDAKSAHIYQEKLAWIQS